MEALEGIDGLGIAQGPPLVSLDAVGFGQYFELLCDVQVVISGFLARGLCTDPLLQRCWGWVGPTIFFRGSGVVPTDQGFQICRANLGSFLITGFVI